MTEEQKMIIWLNWIADNFPSMVAIRGSGWTGHLFRSELLMNSHNGYYKEHPQECWMFQIGEELYHDTFSAKLVGSIDILPGGIVITLKGEK